MSNKKGFTLVELIVIVTILAILATIAFLSFQGYSKSSRDSVRISDLNAIKKSLELLSIQIGKYPIPSGSINFTYSGATVWRQGTFGESVLQQTQKLNKLPKDPLSEVEYTYSVTNIQKEFELGAIFEGDTLSSTLNKTYAIGGIDATAYITGNYNGLITKVSTGGTVYVLAVPSIISRDLETTDIASLITSNKIVFNGYANLPSSYINSAFNIEGGFPNNQTQVEVYSGTDLPTQTDLEIFIQNLESAYSGTLIYDTDYISAVRDANISGDPDVIAELGAQLINNNLGGKIVVVPSNLLPADGTCGSDNGLSLIDTPVNLCSSGNPTGVIDNGIGSSYDWSCSGVSGGTNQSCSANHIANPFTFDEPTGTITDYDPGVGGTDVVIPSSINLVAVTDIGNQAFYNNGLTSVSIPSGVTSIGNGAFQNNNIATIVVPDGVTSIGSQAFRSNVLRSVTLPNSITSIGSTAFETQNGGSFRGTVYGPGVGHYVYTTYQNNTSSAFDKLDLVGYRTNCSEGSCPNQEYMFDETSGTIGEYDPAIGGLTPSIPSSINGVAVTAIGKQAFYNNALTSATIPSGVTSIGDGAFQNNNIATIVVPDGVTSIGSQAFRGNSLRSVTLPNSITSIGSTAFENQNGLSSKGTVYGPGVGHYVYTTYLNNSPSTFDKLDLIGYRSNCSEGSCPNQEYVFDETSGIIGDYDPGIGGVSPVIPSSINSVSVTGLGYQAFYNNNLTSVTIPNGVTSIGGYAFYGNNLASLTIPSGVTEVGTYAFYDNILTNVTIPSSVTSIGSAAFWAQNGGRGTIYGPGAGNYVYTTYQNNTSNEFDKADLAGYRTGCSEGSCPNEEYVFDETSGTIGDYDPGIGGVSPVIPSSINSVSVTGLGYQAFYNNNLTSVTIPSGVTSIGGYAFYGNNLASITIPSGVTEVGTYAFYDNILTNVTIPSSVTSIGSAAFWAQSGGKGTIYGPGVGNYVYTTYQNNSSNEFDKADLAGYRWSCGEGSCPTSEYVFDETSGTIGDYDVGIGGVTPVIPSSINGISVTGVGQQAFLNKGLTSVTIPGGVTSIADGAFQNNNLSTLVIPSGVTSIGFQTFRGNSLTSVTLPNSITNISGYGFYAQGGAGLVVHGPPATHYVETTWTNNTGDAFDKGGSASYIGDQ